MSIPCQFSSFLRHATPYFCKRKYMYMCINCAPCTFITMDPGIFCARIIGRWNSLGVWLLQNTDMLSHIGNRVVYSLCIFLRNGERGLEMIDCLMMVWLWWSYSIAYWKRGDPIKTADTDVYCRPQSTVQWSSQAVVLNLLLNGHLRLSPSIDCSMVITACRPQATAQWSS